MRTILGNVLRLLVGSEYGFSAEGNELWYYTLALAINSMLGWIYVREVALLFTILSVMHLATVYIYGLNDLEDDSKYFSIGYFLIHAVLAIIALLTNWWWAIETAAITVFAVAIAPDCVGQNVFTGRKSGYYKGAIPLVFNTMVFVAFVVVTLMLTTYWWVKALIIVAAIILHPFIDYLESECVDIIDITGYAIDKIMEK